MTLRDGAPSPITPKACLRHDVGEGWGGGDRRTFDVGIPPTPNPSPQGGGGRARRSRKACPETGAAGIQLKDAKDSATGDIVTTWEVRASGATEVQR
jgi:hypothetical protein